MLDVVDVSLAYDGKPALRGVNLHIQQGEIVCLLGPSGCGKTTLLRAVAGLEQIDSGRILYEGQLLVDVPVHQRDMGLMFQDFALFPHMNVRENVNFGLKMHHMPDADARIQEVIRLVGLEGFEKRDIAQLSGGEKQRVALARSLAPRPRLLMLDEPLGSLDATLRERLVVELRQIIKTIGLTAVYVTHDQQEAFAIADRIALMNAGIIEQVDTPQVVYQRPATIFAAEFLRLNNVLPVERYADGQAHTALGAFATETASPAVLLHPLGIRLAGAGEAHTLEGRLEECVFQGDFYRLRLRHESGTTLTFKADANAAMIPAEGEVVSIVIQPEQVIPLGNSAAAP